MGKDSHNIIKNSPLESHTPSQPVQPQPPQLRQQEPPQPSGQLHTLQLRQQELSQSSGQPQPPQLRQQAPPQPSGQLYTLQLRQQEPSESSVQPQSPQLRNQEPWQRPRITILIPSIVHVDRNDFKKFVQRVTGNTSTTSSSNSSSTSVASDSSRGLISPTAQFNPNSENLTPRATSLPIRTLDFSRIGQTDTQIAPSNGLFPSPSVADEYYNQQRQYQPQMSYPQSGSLKRTRSDFERPSSAMPLGHDMNNYQAITHRVDNIRPIGSAYDLHLQSVQTPSMTYEEAGSFNGVGMGRPGGNNPPPMDSTDRPSQETVPRLPDVSNTLYGPLMDSVGRSSRGSVPLPLDVSNTLHDGLPYMPSEGAGLSNGIGMGRPGGNNMISDPLMGELMAGRTVLLPPDFGQNSRVMGIDQLDSVGRSSHEPVTLPHDESDILYDELFSMSSEEAGPFNGVGMGRQGGNNMRGE